MTFSVATGCEAANKSSVYSPCEFAQSFGTSDAYTYRDASVTIYRGSDHSAKSLEVSLDACQITLIP